MVSRLIAAALLVVAGGALLLTVSVHGPGTRSASCGSAWDVIAGRAGWQQWWAQDLADPVGDGGLVRTDRCPGAVNDRIIVAGALAVGAVAIVSAGAVMRHRRPRARGGEAGRLRLLGLSVTAVGSVLTVGGLVGLALLTADPAAPMFLYVSRASVVLIGLLLILPAILLIVLGRGMGVLAEHMARAEAADEAP